MVQTRGLVGLRPDPSRIARVTAPPYDVIKEGSPLWARLFGDADSMVHVSLGPDPRGALEGLRARGALVADETPAYYVYEQRWGGEARTGVLVAAAVTDYAARQIIRHEKTFDDKVKGRVALANAIDHTIGPVFLLTKSSLGEALERAKAEAAPLYDFATDFGPGTDLTGVASRVWRVLADSPTGAAIAAHIAGGPLYIADGHHRYHAALKNGQTHVLAYVTEGARILAYDRVVNGRVPFETARAALDLSPCAAFATPAKHEFCLYTKQGSWTLRAERIPADVVGRLDCAILERELYPHLGLEHRHIVDPAHFDYYPESALDEMKAAVDAGKYELAIALHPVGIDELMAVADAGLDDPDVVMPEKSTFFSPKVLTGIFLYRHERRG
ncbi:MAG: DUF1015 domain-containing protein [Sandaracinaceae bacterium]|nr:DUF1015 domain-containing protein [Sandaracinaceae bacterium]